MEEFSDLDEETGINIAHMNNIEISRNVVGLIEYDYPENKIHINRQDDLNYNLFYNFNDNLIDIDKKLERNQININYDSWYQKKNYLNYFDKSIDKELQNNLNKKDFELVKKSYFIDDIEDLNYNNSKAKHFRKEYNNSNRFLEITKNFNKILKREKNIDNKLLEENQELKFP